MNSQDIQVLWEDQFEVKVILIYISNNNFVI